MGSVRSFALARLASAIVIAVAIGTPSLVGATWHVASTAPCPGAGSVQSPFCTIQAAIAAASSGDDILVQSGTYPEAIDLMGKTLRLESVSGAASTTIGGPAFIGSVITMVNGEVGVEIVGFRVIPGSGTSIVTPFGPVPELCGGGILAVGASFELRESIVDGKNWSPIERGGGVYAEGGSATVAGTVFMGDLIASTGAGMFLINVSSAVIQGNDVDARDASSGVGIGAWHCQSVQIIGNVIHDNGEVSQHSGAQSGSGVGVNTVACADVVIRGNHFFANIGSGSGGAVFLGGFGGNSTVLIESNVFESNSASEGGAIGCGDVDATIRNNIFDGNFSSYGAAIMAGASSGNRVVIEDCEVRSSPGYSLAAAIYLRDFALPVEVRRCTIADNIYGIWAIGAGAIVEDCVFDGNEIGCRMANSVVRRSTFVNNLYGSIDADKGLVRVESCILYDNGLVPNSEIYISGTATVEVSDSIVEDGYPGTNVLNVDPQFMNPIQGDYRLKSTSPAIDMGLAGDSICSVDVDGLPRRVSGSFAPIARVDMGAHEFSHIALSATVPAAGMIQLDAIGTMGLATLLWVGVGEAEVCLPSAGTLLFDVTQPFLVLPWGPLPASLTASTAALPAGVVLRAQAMALSGGLANLSGAIDIEG